MLWFGGGDLEKCRWTVTRWVPIPPWGDPYGHRATMVVDGVASIQGDSPPGHRAKGGRWNICRYINEAVEMTNAQRYLEIVRRIHRGKYDGKKLP